MEVDVLPNLVDACIHDGASVYNEEEDVCRGCSLLLCGVWREKGCTGMRGEIERAGVGVQGWRETRNNSLTSILTIG